MKKIISLVLCTAMLLPIFTLMPLAQDTTSEPSSESASLQAELTTVYNGATGIVSMSFDDGDYGTALWLNEMFERYNLQGSLMMIVNKNYEKNVTYNGVTYTPAEMQENWRNLFADGRLQPESHSYTHAPIPANWWSNYSKYYTNNTDEIFDREVNLSYDLIKEYTGYTPVVYAASNNTLAPESFAYVTSRYYAARLGVRWSLSESNPRYQSLDPEVGLDYTYEYTVDETLSAEEKSERQLIGAGGWYNPMMVSFASQYKTIIPQVLEKCANEGYWFISMCHGINDTNGDVTYAIAEDLFRTMAEYQNEGKLWVTTYGNAVRYIRERQNSTVSAYQNASGVFVEVTMADMTADNLPLPNDLFNLPLTVKCEVPADWSGVTYLLNGETQYTETFAEDGKTYALVNVVPDSGAIRLKSILYDEGVTLPFTAGTLSGEGTFTGGQMNINGETNAFTISEYSKTYASIDLSDHFELADVHLSIEVKENVNATLHVYGLMGEENETFNASGLNAYNAPANDRFTNSMDLSAVMNGAPITSISITGAGIYTLNVTDYANELCEQDIKRGTIIFVLDDASEDHEITFTFTGKIFYSSSKNFNDLTAPTIVCKSADITDDVDLFFTGTTTEGTVTVDGDDTNRYVSFDINASSWYLMKIHKLFDFNWNADTDIGRTFKITFKMRERQESVADGATPTGSYVGMATLKPGTTFSGNGTSGSGLYQKTHIKNSAFDVWEEKSYTFSIDSSFFTDTQLPETLCFFSGSPKTRTIDIDDVVIEEIEQDTSSLSYYSYFEDVEGGTVAENSTAGIAVKRGGIGSGYSTLTVSDQQNGTPTEGASKSIEWSTGAKSYEKIYIMNLFRNGEITEEDIGKTFRVSFRYYTTGAAKINMELTEYDSSYQKVPPKEAAYNTALDAITVTADNTGRWFKWTKDITITEDFIKTMTLSKTVKDSETGEDVTTTADYTFYISEILVYLTGVTAGTKIYFDDIKSIELIDGIAPEHIQPTEVCTIGGDTTTETSVVSINAEVKPLAQNKALIAFSPSQIKAIANGVLSFDLKSGKLDTLNIYALRSEQIVNESSEVIFPLLAQEALDQKLIYSALPLTATQEGTTVYADVTEYLRKYENDGVFFLIEHPEYSKIEYINFDFAKLAPTDNVDYSATGNATLEDGTLTVTGGEISFRNILCYGNTVCEAGVEYTVTATVSAGVTVSFLGQSVTSTEAGVISFTVTSDNAVTSELTFCGEDGYTVSGFSVSAIEPSAIVENAALTLKQAPVALSESVTIYHDFIHNIYVVKNARIQSIEWNGVLYTGGTLEAFCRVIEGENMYCFPIHNAPSEITDATEITINVLGAANGSTEARPYTLSTFGYFKSLSEMDGITDSLATLVRDALSYSRAHSKYFGFTEAEAQIGAYLSEISYTDIENAPTTLTDAVAVRPSANSGLKSATMMLNEQPKLVFVPTDDMKDADFTFTIGDNTTVDYEVYTTAAGKVYLLLDLAPASLRETVSYTAGEYSGSYNLRAYYEFASTDETLKSLIERLWKFSEACENFVG